MTITVEVRERKARSEKKRVANRSSAIARGETIDGGHVRNVDGLDWWRGSSSARDEVWTTGGK
jgi:hypothetical protein